MQLTQIVFSPTGGTQQVVDILTEALGLPFSQIDLTDAQKDFAAVSLPADSLALIAVPAYAGRVPAVAAQRLAQIQGNQSRCVLVSVSGACRSGGDCRTFHYAPICGRPSRRGG